MLERQQSTMSEEEIGSVDGSDVALEHFCKLEGSDCGGKEKVFWGALHFLPYLAAAAWGAAAGALDLEGELWTSVSMLALVVILLALGIAAKMKGRSKLNLKTEYAGGILVLFSGAYLVLAATGVYSLAVFVSALSTGNCDVLFVILEIAEGASFSDLVLLIDQTVMFFVQDLSPSTQAKVIWEAWWLISLISLLVRSLLPLSMRVTRTGGLYRRAG
jgi:hypothetical protein